jgi:hypothetical protein
MNPEVASVEPLVEEAIALLEAHGFTTHAESLRDRLARIESAPTAAARRRRALAIALPPVAFATAEPREGCIRWTRTESDRRDESRYRRLLQDLARAVSISVA